jgi:hypothetical protein
MVNPGDGTSGRVAARYQEDAEGEETAREAAARRGDPPSSGSGAITLWRGAKGYERVVWGMTFLRHSVKRKPQRPAQAKAREGAKNP